MVYMCEGCCSPKNVDFQDFRKYVNKIAIYVDKDKFPAMAIIQGRTSADQGSSFDL